MSTIMGAMQARSGTVAVWTRSELYLFDSTGAYLSMPGRRGAGPGEFRVVGGVAECANGRFTAWDPYSRRLTLISRAVGAILGSRSDVREQFMTLAGCFAGHPVFVHRPFDFSSQERKQEVLEVVELDTVGTSRDTVFVGNGILHAGPVMQLFPSFLVVAARDSVLAIGDNASGMLRRWHGRREDSVKVLIPHQGVSEAVADSMKQVWYGGAMVGGRVDPAIVQAIDLGWSKLPLSDSIPLFSAMQIDDHGSVWLSGYGGHPGIGPIHITRWTKVDVDGAPVAVLPMPPGFQLMQISHGAALGIQEQEDGSLAVVLRRIEGS